MSRDNLIERLLVLPCAIAETERRLLDAETARANFQAHLTAVEDQLLLSGALDGHNAEQRAAQRPASTAARLARETTARSRACRRAILGYDKCDGVQGAAVGALPEINKTFTTASNRGDVV